MSSDDSKSRFLHYKEGPLTGMVIAVLSLFSQWLNWYAFEKLGYSWIFTLFTPLILCIAYHLVALDAGRDGNFSRRFLALFAVVVPLVTGIVLTVIMLIASPDISNFDPETAYSGTVQERIATYSGRFVLTSAYLGVFALIDMPVLKWLDGRK